MKRLNRLKSLAVCAVLFASASPILTAQTTSVHFNVDLQQSVQPISRLIYGSNQTLDAATNLTFTRLGGNRWTAYNWVNNASNAGSDYLYQNDSYLGGGNTPGGAVSPTLANASARNAGALITIPMNGYVSADKNGGGDVRNSGANYLTTRFRQGAAAKGSAFTLAPDPNAPVVYQDEFVNWVQTNYAYGFTDPNRPISFSLDNEPDLWSSTHAEVHPAAATYAEMVSKTIAYATAIKAIAPNAKVYGPVNYGWNGFTSLQNATDANANGDFQSYYLHQMALAGQSAGKRLVDALDVHWYPEATGGGVRITGQDTTAAVVAARLQAPRSLWDTTYTETSWITQDSTHGPIKLIPTLQAKIAANYAGTKLSFSEYNYGGGNDISGGIAEADVLGIFGRSGIYSANEWPSASNEAFITAAMKMYRNFDGHSTAFGDTSVLAGNDDVADTSIYASTDSTSPNRLVLVAINKSDHAITASLSLTNGKTYKSMDVYTLTGGSAAPVFAGNLSIANPASFNYVMPAYSVSTLNVLVPEPGALSLLGLAAVATLRRRRMSALIPLPE
jgi:hypothetical protein